MAKVMSHYTPNRWRIRCHRGNKLNDGQSASLWWMRICHRWMCWTLCTWRSAREAPPPISICNWQTVAATWIEIRMHRHRSLTNSLSTNTNCKYKSFSSFECGYKGVAEFAKTIPFMRMIDQWISSAGKTQWIQQIAQVAHTFTIDLFR